MILKIIAALAIVLLYILKAVIPSSSLWLIVGYEGSIVFSTIMHHGDISTGISNAIAVLTVSALIEYCIRNDPRYILNIVYCVFYVFTIINLLTVLYHGFTVGSSWDGVINFLGIDNRFVFTFLPMIAFGAILAGMQNKGLYQLLLIILIAFITLLYTWSVAAFAAIGMCLAVVIVLNSNLKVNKVLTRIGLGGYLVIIGILNLLFVFWHIQDNFYNFFVNTLHKDISLSGRTFLWEKGIQKITNSPILGYGINENKVMQLLEGLVHFHNYFINMLYQGGLIAFSFFVLLNIVTIIKSKKYKLSYTYHIISFIIFISLFLSVFDTLDYTFLYVFYIIMGNLKYFEKTDDNPVRVLSFIMAKKPQRLLRHN